MRKLMLCLAALVVMLGTAARAQDFAGDWQGTLKQGNVRVVVKIAKSDHGWSAILYNADQALQPLGATSVKVEGSTLKFSVDAIVASFEGKMSGDGKQISGTWSRPPDQFPLTLVRATPDTTWEIPEAPKPSKPMPADADPSFDVATIKPNVSGAATVQQLTIIGRNFTLRNGSLADMIAFAYNVQLKQVVGGPDWIDKDRYDIAAVPDVEGSPSLLQLRSMVRKLLADRFALMFHHEKREMAAFVLTVGRSGQKLTPSQSKEALPSMAPRLAANGLTLVMTNSTMTDVTGFLQMLVLDRPVVDQTGVAGRYDVAVTFTPDDSEFNGRPPKLPAPPEGTEPAPDLFNAFQQQLGMKLSAEKTQVDVIAIDKVGRPSAN
jgi:uncharacterized protein (TIGR03435 family)